MAFMLKVFDTRVHVFHLHVRDRKTAEALAMIIVKNSFPLATGYRVEER